MKNLKPFQIITKKILKIESVIKQLKAIFVLFHQNHQVEIIIKHIDDFFYKESKS